MHAMPNILRTALVSGALALGALPSIAAEPAALRLELDLAAPGKPISPGLVGPEPTLV